MMSSAQWTKVNVASRKIGNALVPPVGFGAMGISIAYGPVGSDEERFKVLDAAYEQGCTHWDTSDAYGDSEELIGKWFRRTGKRNEIFLATKFGFAPGGVIRGDYDYVKHALGRSLERLGVDTIDLYYIHRVDPKTPIEVTIGAMAEAVKEGKVKYLGISECTPQDLRRAHVVHPISAYQMEVSPFSRHVLDPKLEFLKTARELGATMVVYSPLGRGMLTGQLKSLDDLAADDYRRTIPRYSRDNLPKILDVVSRIKEVGARHNATAGQVTLAWVLAQGDDFVVIPGTKNTKYVEENAGAAALELTSEEVAAITKIAEEAEIPGERYGPSSHAKILVNSPAL